MGGRRRWMVVAAVAGLICAVISGILLERRRSQALIDTGETRASVEASLRKVLPRTVEFAQSPGLRSAFEQLQKERYVVSVWVVDPGGVIVLRWRGPGKQGEKVQDLAWGDALALIQALGPEGLSESQKLQMLAVAAVRREGEHNDVFRHLVSAVPNGTGELAALVVLAYDVSPGLGSPPNAGYIGLLGTALAGFLLYWLGLPWWVYLDARARGDAAALWGVFVLFTNLVGLIGYLIVISRPGRGRD